LVWLALAWIVGIITGRELSVSPWIIWLSASGLLMLTAASMRRNHPQWSLMLLFLTAALGALAYSHFRAALPVERLYPLLEHLGTIRGLVISYPARRPERTAFVLSPQGLPGRLQVFYYHPRGAPKPVAYGDLIELEGRFQIPWEFEDFNYREYLRSRGIWGIATVWSAGQIEQISSGQGDLILRWGYRTRLALFEVMDRHLSERESGLLKGLIFGERAYMTEELERSFRDAGVMHVLAVSGMNLGILLTLFWLMLRPLRPSLTQSYLGLIPFVLIYLILVGFEVSLMRAALLFGFVTLGWVLAERGLILKGWVDPLQGLAAAALVILAFTPQALFDISFQLSFAATAGILIAWQLLWPAIEEQSERLYIHLNISKSKLREASFKSARTVFGFLLVSLAAQLAVAPFLAYHFHRVYLGAVLANLIVVPLATLAIWLGVLLLILGWLPLGPLAAAAGVLTGWTLEVLISATDFFSRLPWAYFMVDRGLQITALVLLPLALSPYLLRWLQLMKPSPPG